MALWDRRGDENDLEFAAFRAYRDQVPPRNIRRAAAASPPEVTVLKATECYSKFNWKERVRAYDEHLDKVLQEEKEEVLRRGAKERALEHAALLKDARDALTIELRKLLQWTQDVQVGVMQPQQIIKLQDSVVKLERLVGGESTENTQNSIDVSGLSLDEIRSLDNLLSKANISLPGVSRGAKNMS